MRRPTKAKYLFSKDIHCGLTQIYNCGIGSGCGALVHWASDHVLVLISLNGDTNVGFGWQLEQDQFI